MSAERSTESIIDLLYGELSEEEEREVREELTDSVELQAEYDELDSLLGRVREAMPREDVSPSIHASILEAARVAVEQPDEDRMIRRNAPEEQGFWGRVARGQGSQIALVAAVLIAGLFVVRAVDKSDSPLHAPASDISAMREAAPAAPAVMARDEADEVPGDAMEAPEGGEQLAATEEEAIQGAAIADQWSPEPPPAPEEAAQAEPPADIAKSLRNELGRSAPADRDVEDDKKTRAPRKPAPKRRASAAPAPSKPAPSKGAKEKAADGLLDMFGDSDGRGAESTPSSRNVQGKSGADTPAPVQQAEAKAEEQAYRPPPNSISEVQTYFRNNDYGGAIQAADKFLSSNKSASEMERANALHIKAQSLEKQGKHTAADRIYESLQQNYPSYEAAQISNAREEIRRKNTRRKQKKSKPKLDEAREYAPADSTSVD